MEESVEREDASRKAEMLVVVVVIEGGIDLKEMG